jgi:hypothetical protein
MRKTFTVLMMLTLTCGVVMAPAAMAQTRNGAKNGSGSSTGAAAGMSDPPVTAEAPVGHRQPRPADIPSNADDPMRIHADDAALDRQIKSICRGC